MNFSKETFLKRFEIKGANTLEETLHKMTMGEKVLFFFFVFLLMFSVISMMGKINKYITAEVPTEGGEMNEGVIGFPRFINPLLVSSDADRDLVALVYSGLMKADSSGNLIPDLAENYYVSDDGLEYRFIIKSTAQFHDGTPVTADDVIFTINKTRDPLIKSTKRPNWEGVNVEKISDKEILFTLKHAYSPFLENTTIGILPKHIWGNIDSEQFAFSSFNIDAIGSGPYMIEAVKRNSSGIPESYKLKSFKYYTLGKPHITNITLNFFSNEDSLISAFRSGKINAVNGISTDTAKTLSNNGYRVEQSPLPRIFGVFLNQNQATIFTDISVRKALATAIDRKLIINEILNGYGTPITSPIPGYALNQSLAGEGVYVKINDNSIKSGPIQKAEEILENAGWKLNADTGIREKKIKGGSQELVFTVATSNAAELKAVAEMIKRSWESIGAKVNIELYEIGTLNQEVIRPRKYDALLFGEIIGREMDLFAFWHSSQRNDPGLNVALYANITADKMLEKIRLTDDKETRAESFEIFEEEIQKDIPAIFLYSPDFIYAIPKHIKGVMLGTITTPSERFLEVHNWYINTERVWKFLTKDNSL
ncbi:hypothetical protein COW81_02220 [Candidatus Campbellbacteria bacterium CG22_combo_CG10-13_8_21_14_all_36_13]|uniref:Solute-binding protein family 5 domain-containing protein n=1 Tax=Candidatus Campbellbacteria bacterium CG22_combo_CG10-13_8_21_14_all_36_13 TaxID=1974529 RepID=A0A2H0DYM4_9BACT|nr:MAG: hypothetical protein COW81_02220 [Candidatus Campbellbacteria bacterium CG22_combo_CG10-13_8_21_14_all_36_13]